MSKDGIACRIAQLLEILNVRIAEFERSIGASNGLIRKAIANGTDIQSKWATAIIERYPQVSALWLLTGSGEIINSTTSSHSFNIKGDISRSVVGHGGNLSIIGGKLHEKEDLSHQLLERIILEKDRTITTLSDTNDALREQIKTKDEQIHTILMAAFSPKQA